jgi:hypothetical protein
MEGVVYFVASWAVCFSAFVPGWVTVAILRTDQGGRAVRGQETGLAFFGKLKACYSYVAQSALKSQPTQRGNVG